MCFVLLPAASATAAVPIATPTWTRDLCVSVMIDFGVVGRRTEPFPAEGDISAFCLFLAVQGCGPTRTATT